MRPFFVALAAGALVLPGCEPAPAPPVKTPEVNEAFPLLPLPPGAEIVSRQGSADALQFTIRSSHPMDAVAVYYRDMMSRPPWRLISDTRDATGAVAIFAEGERRPLWIRIAADSLGTTVDLTGAVSGLDSAYARKRRTAADSTNTMLPR